MKRLTNSNPENNLQTLLNYAYAKDGGVKLSYADGEYGADLCEYISAKSKEVRCGLEPSPKDVQEGACMECDCELGLLYLIATQAAELRARLMMIEDILGDEYDLVDLQKKVKGVEIDQFKNWIPVTERLPEREGRYLCVKRIGKSGMVYVQVMNGDSYGFSMEHIYTDDVTHWMPLPEPPTTEV